MEDLTSVAPSNTSVPTINVTTSVGPNTLVTAQRTEGALVPMPGPSRSALEAICGTLWRELTDLRRAMCGCRTAGVSKPLPR